MRGTAHGNAPYARYGDALARNHPISEFRRVYACDAAKHRSGEQPVARQITRSPRARDADRRTAGGEQIRERAALLVQHARLAVDRKAALRVEQRTSDFDGTKRRPQLLVEHAAEAIRRAELDLRLLAQCLSRNADAHGELINR